MRNSDWKDYAELAGIAAVIVTLLILVLEVRQNTAAIERQSAIDRANSFSAPFFDSRLPEILASKYSVDGVYPPVSTYMETYGWSAEDAILWERHLALLWETLEAEHAYAGPNEELDNLISALLSNQDNQIYVDAVSRFRFREEFRAYVDALRSNLDAWYESAIGTND